MASKHPNAPLRASGLVHRNVRLTTRYVVVSNDLAQHAKLSFTAIGIAVYIQSLPAGAHVGIKALAAEHQESELRIAAAMRELEAHGFLARTRERMPDGRFLPRTVSYNRPGAEPDPVRKTPPPSTDEEPAPPRAFARKAPRAAEPPKLADVHLPGAALLTGLRAIEPLLLLSEQDVRRLAPGVTAWLERGAHPDAVRRTLCAALPHDLAHPAGLLAHRLAALLPPPLPAGPSVAPQTPFQNCDDCERAFRAPEPGRCRECESVAGDAAA
ncbi:helix-turn-helix domain-containing protein [Streptomyces sp. NPDC058486]|uniref:helix-turn-helix domain-containing protein n=1 Tax=unclassified Streptomyces TaxID=2593676 RepID=UPI0036639960